MKKKFLKVKDLKLEITTEKNLLGKKLPVNVEELNFSYVGEITDIKRIKDMFTVFSHMLSRLAETGSIERQQPL